jgi:hypothetical protein
LLKLEDAEPNDPSVFVSAVPNWTVGETFTTGRGHEWRILAIDTEIADAEKAGSPRLARVARLKREGKTALAPMHLFAARAP